MNNYHKKTTSTLTTLDITIIAIFAAIICILSIIPTGIYILGVPLTLQTFAMAFSGYALGYKKGFFAVVIYILLGIIGLPVFSGFNGGIQALFNVTGGFIVGFLFIAIFTGISKKHPIILGLIGLICCHILGIIVAVLLLKNSILNTTLLISVPYIIKDILSIIAAYICAKSVKRSLRSINLSLL